MCAKLSAQEVILRSATAEDADWAVPLVFASGPALFSYVFASPPEVARDILQQAFVYPGHAFSYEHVQVVEIMGAPVGLMLSYAGSVKRQAEEKVHGVMARLLPLHKLPRILVNLTDLSRIKQDVAATDYYILSLCVEPDFRDLGIGKYLLTHGELQARRSGCKTMCLDITYVNTQARELFEHYGFEVTCSKTSDRFQQMTRAGGLHRMTKILN